MTKKVYEIEKMPFVEFLIKDANTRKLKITWSSNDSVAKIATEDKGKIKITFPEYVEDMAELEGSVDVEFDELGEAFLVEAERLYSLKLTDGDIEHSIFKGESPNDLKDNKLHVGKNKPIFEEICSLLASIGIEEVNVGKNFSNNNMVFDKVTLCIRPNFSSRYENVIKQDKINALWRAKFGDSATLPSVSTTLLKPVEHGEDLKEIMIGDVHIGRYYPKRNMVVLALDPFHGHNLERNKAIKNVTTFFKPLLFSLKPIKELNLKYNDAESFKVDILLNEFSIRAKDETDSLENVKKDIAQRIGDYNTRLISAYDEQELNNSKLEGIKNFNSNKKDVMIREIEKARKSALIEDVTIDNEAIWFKFKPTTAKAAFGRDVDAESGRHGIRQVYLGSLTFGIFGNGIFEVKSDASAVCGNPHPHADEGGRPCLGSGQGKKTIHQLIAQRQFGDLVMMLWMWIKKIRPGYEHMFFNQYYDDRLIQGYPVLDQEGNRIEINDEDRIKSGEQQKLTITKEQIKTQQANIEKFKEFKA